jgi:bifunctional non-homologous end joining protein LigD
MKAQLVDSIRPGDWLYEIKFDGYRALALRGGSETRILSRNQKDLGKKFTKIRDSIAALDVQDAILDGEIVALDDKGRSSFQLLQGFDMGMVRPPIVFHVFDLLRLNGQDLRSWPIEERKAKLAALLKRPPADIRYSASFTQNIDELLSKVRALSLEGLIGKRAGSKYDSKRSGAWIKIKLYQQGSLVVGGYTQPGGERKYMGALLVGVHENGKLKFAGRVGTGFSEKLLKSLSVGLNKIAVKACPFYDLPVTGRGLDPGLSAAEVKRCIWVKPSIVCEVKFTRSGPGTIVSGSRSFLESGKTKMRAKWSGKRPATRIHSRCPVAEFRRIKTLVSLFSSLRRSTTHLVLEPSDGRKCRMEAHAFPAILTLRLRSFN